MTTKEMVQVAQWIDEGVCEYKRSKDWESYPYGASYYNISSLEEFSSYRCKPTLTLRPWRPEEVPVGAQLMTPSGDRCLIVCISIVNVYYSNDNSYVSLTEIASFPKWKHSTDQGKTWQPCGSYNS